LVGADYSGIASYNIKCYMSMPAMLMMDKLATKEPKSDRTTVATPEIGY